MNDMTDYNRSFSDQPADVVQICREISSSVMSSERNVSTAKTIIQRLFKNRNTELCSILPGQMTNFGEIPFNIVYDMINGYSPFFDTCLEDESLCDELWNGILIQCETAFDCAKDSVLMNVVSTYVTRLLPCDETINTLQKSNQNKTSQTVKTPLQLFRSTSPLVNRINIAHDSRSDAILTNVNLQPKFVSIFCSLVMKTCNTSQYPTPTRLLLLRYLLKQYHVFCQFLTLEENIDSLKAAMMSQPPFRVHLYNFLSDSLHHCPTMTLFKDITMCWMTFCRPWRYSDLNNPELPPHGQFTQFVQQNYDFYRVLLGKILKKFSYFEINCEMISMIRAVVEFAWKEPQCILMRTIEIDIQSPVINFLKQLKPVVNMHQNIIKKEQVESSGFLNSLFGNYPTKSEESGRLVKELEALINDSDRYLGTKLLADITIQPGTSGSNDTLLSDRTSQSCAIVETPKSSLAPDHFIDAKYNYMLLTNSGKQQVMNGERKFNFSKCLIDNPYSSPTTREIGILVRFMTYLSEKLSETSFVRSVASHYGDPTPFGRAVRTIMYAPVPNPDPNVFVPVFAPALHRRPALLKLRAFADLFTLSLLFISAGTFYYGWMFLFLSVLILFFIAVLCMSLDS